jgi:hypothetical protein
MSFRPRRPPPPQGSDLHTQLILGLGTVLFGASVTALSALYTTPPLGGVGWVPLTFAVLAFVTGTYLLIAAFFKLSLPSAIALPDHHRGKISGVVLVLLSTGGLFIIAVFPHKVDTSQPVPSSSSDATQSQTAEATNAAPIPKPSPILSDAIPTASRANSPPTPGHTLTSTTPIIVEGAGECSSGWDPIGRPECELSQALQQRFNVVTDQVNAALSVDVINDAPANHGNDWDDTLHIRATWSDRRPPLVDESFPGSVPVDSSIDVHTARIKALDDAIKKAVDYMCGKSTPPLTCG